jgi:hypothetical protein
VNRRDAAITALGTALLGGSGLGPRLAGAASRPASVATAPVPGPDRPANAPAPADLAATLKRYTAEQSLRQFMRMFATLDGEIALVNEGLIHGRPPDDVARPLFGFRSVVQIRAREVEPNVFRTEQREAMYYLDRDSGEPLTEWRNPFTGEMRVPVGYVSPLNVYFFDVTGSYARQLPPQRSGRKNLDWRASDTDVWVSESRFNTFPAGVTEEEFPLAYSGPERKSVDILTYRTSRAEFGDERAKGVLAQVQMVSDTPWPLWMMMAKRPGHVLWNGFGKKYPSFDALPALVRTQTEQVYPKFIADPWAFPEREFSTLNGLKRLKAAGKI